MESMAAVVEVQQLPLAGCNRAGAKQSENKKPIEYKHPGLGLMVEFPKTRCLSDSKICSLQPSTENHLRELPSLMESMTFLPRWSSCAHVRFHAYLPSANMTIQIYLKPCCLTIE